MVSIIYPDQWGLCFMKNVFWELLVLKSFSVFHFRGHFFSEILCGIACIYADIFMYNIIR